MTSSLRHGGRVFCLVLVLGLGHAAFSEVPAGKPIINVGIVYDGSPPDGDSLAPERYRGLLEMIQQETQALTDPQFDVRFPESKQLSGNWQVEDIRASIDRLLADSDVHLVLTLGIFATNEVCRRRELSKPVIAPMAVDIAAQSLPVDHDGEGRLISGVPNLSYLSTPGTIMRDLRRFRELVEYSRVHVLTDALVAEAIPEIPEAVMAGGEALGATIAPPVLVVASADEALAALPPDAEAVYVTPLHRLASEEFERLVAGLIERGLPTFSLVGRDEVELGVMAGVRPETNFVRLSRRIALNVQRILLGEDAGQLPVALQLQEKLVINMATASAIRVFPKLRVAMEAELIHPGAEAIEETLTLAQAVREAVEANLSLRAAERSVVAGRENVRRARSALKPQLQASAGGLKIDADRASASFGTQSERTVTAGVSMSQILYSNAARSGLAITRQVQLSREHEWEARRLDVALQAATAFLNLLRAETLERINQENLRLTESNLELARRREQVGFSGPAEVYRWESRLATARSELLHAHSVVHLAFVELNRILDRPLEGFFVANPPSLVDPGLITGFGRLNQYVDNAASFTLFKDFMVRDALLNAPELKSIEAAIAAAERSLSASRRSFWAPDLILFGDARRDVSRGGEGGTVPSPADSNDWSVGVEASLPLYAGGARRADRRQDREELSVLRLEWQSLVQQVEQRARAVLYEITSTFPAIELTQEAARAARKNLELVTDSYARGVVTVIDLIDAQNNALVAEGVAANAEYDFLIDLMRLQRATSRFDFFESDEARAVWFERLEAYFIENEDRIRWPMR